MVNGLEPLGIFLYGYSEDDSKNIKSSLENKLKSEIMLISGSRKEHMRLMDILEKGPDENEFYDSENKILVFLGFDEGQINLVLQKFSTIESVTRPIFCGLTEQNVNWELKNLIEHLLEEEKYWSNKKD